MLLFRYIILLFLSLSSNHIEARRKRTGTTPSLLPRSLKKKAPIQQLVNAVGLNDHRILFEVLGEEPLTITQMLKTVGVTNLHSLLKLDTTDLTELLEISDKQTTKLLHFAKAALSFAKQNNDRRKKENKPLNSASSVPSVPSAPPVQSTPPTPPTPSTPSTSSAPIKPPLEPKPKKIPKTKSRPIPVVQVPTNNKRETVIDEHNTGVSKDKTFADDLFSMFPEFNALRKEVNQANEEADEADSRIVSEGFNNLFPTLKLTEVHIDDITDEDERDQEREQERKHQENSVPPPPSPLPTTKATEGEEEEDVTEEEILVGIQMEHERQKIKEDSMKHTEKEDEVNVKNRQRAEETKQRKKAQRKKKKPKNKKKKKRKKSSEAWNDRHDELYDKIVDFYAERELFKKLAKDNKIKSLTRDYIDNEKALFDKLIEKYGVHGQARRSGKENQKKNPKKQNPKKQNPKEKNTKEKNTKEKNTKEKNTREKNNHNNHYQKSNKSNREADTQYMFGFTEWLDGLSPGLKSLMMHCVVFFMAFTFQMMLLSPAFLLVACHGTIKPPWILYWIGYCGPSGMFKYMLYDCCRLNVIGVKLYHLAKKSSPSSTKYNRYLSTGLFVSIFWCSFVSRLVVNCVWV